MFPQRSAIGVGQLLAGGPFTAESGAAKVGRLFVASGDANTLYVQMPSVWGTALSHRLQKGIFTATASVGFPAQPWRRTSLVEVPTVDSPATTGILFTLTDLTNTGAVDYAFQNSATGFIFGGSFHGGETISAEQWYADGAAITPATTARQASTFKLERMTTVDWGGGNTMSVTFSLTFNADGTVTEAGSFTSTSAFSTQYAGMDIFTPAFGERRNAGNIVTTTVDSDVSGDAADITYRAPASGHAVRLLSNIPSATRYQKTATDAQQTQVKHYPQIATTAGGPFGTIGYSRTSSYAKGNPNPYYWSGPANSGDENGWQRVSGFNSAGVAWDNANKQVVFTRSAGTGGTARVVWPVTGLTIGQAYTLTGSMAVAGGSPSAGMVIGISPNANGSSATALANAAAGAYSAAISGAAISATTMYVTANQSWVSGSDNVLRINEWKLT